MCCIQMFSEHVPSSCSLPLLSKSSAGVFLQAAPPFLLLEGGFSCSGIPPTAAGFQHQLTLQNGDFFVPLKLYFVVHSLLILIQTYFFMLLFSKIRGSSMIATWELPLGPCFRIVLCKHKPWSEESPNLH